MHQGLTLKALGERLIGRRHFCPRSSFVGVRSWTAFADWTPDGRHSGLRKALAAVIFGGSGVLPNPFGLARRSL